MADPFYIQIDGLDELLDALETAAEQAQPLLEQAMARSLAAIQGRVREYPPASEANRPRTTYQTPPLRGRDPNRWYERGYGTKWITADGKVRGKKVSRFLGRQWTQRVQVVDTGIVGILGNSTPYADEVQGRSQKAYHARRGWITLDTAIEQSTADIEAAFAEAADQLLAALAD